MKIKDFSGAGIVYKFLLALDSELWVEYADEFFGLMCLGKHFGRYGYAFI